MKKRFALLAFLLVAFVANATVRIFVQDTNGVALIKYECTGGEVVRSFALNVTVDSGVILGVSEFARGPSTAVSRGYGIFPSAFRDYVTVTAGTNADWTSIDYQPIAKVADNPADTLPGLNSSGVTLEFAAVWDPANPGAAPGANGILCALQVSQAAKVTITANSTRGGIVGWPSDATPAIQYISATVDPEIAITGANVLSGVMFISFKGGELESAPTPMGPWTGTGNTSGFHSEPIDFSGSRFYRVHH